MDLLSSAGASICEWTRHRWVLAVDFEGVRRAATRPARAFRSRCAAAAAAVTVSCVMAPGNPMASSMADAIAAPTPVMPLSPAPLIYSTYGTCSTFRRWGLTEHLRWHDWLKPGKFHSSWHFQRTVEIGLNSEIAAEHLT